jgi:tRNA A-37 threonylcarbamoyl transferase component Bud32
MSIRTVKNGTQWTVREGYESISDKINLDDFRSGINGENYTLIKENRVRSVISMPDSDVSENGIYIKYFKRGGYSDYVKYLFVPTRTRTEWDIANELLSQNINTALPLATAEKKTCGLLDSSLLVTEAVTNSESLMEFCQANYEGALSGEKEDVKNKLLDKLAGFIRNIHEKGFFHCDLHAGNILIKFKDNPPYSAHDYDLYLMDLHSVKILKKVSNRKRLHNLAQIFNSLSSILTESDKLDFLRSYGSNIFCSIKNKRAQYQVDNHPISPPSQGGERGEVGKSNRNLLGIEQSLVGQIESQSSRIRNIHYRSRLKRCLKESSAFSKKRVEDMKIFFRKGYDTNSLAELIKRHHNALVNDDRTAIIKRDTKTALTRLYFQGNAISNVVVKQYKITCGLCLCKNIFLASAGKKAWVAGNGLPVYGLNTPEPLALIEKKMFGITTDSYLIMEEVKDRLEMDRYILKKFHNQLEATSCKGRGIDQSGQKSRPVSSSYERGILKYYVTDTTASAHPPELFGQVRAGSQGWERDEVNKSNETPLDTDQLHQPQRGKITPKRTFINDLAKTIGKMHNHNIYHHDLKTCNIMVKEEHNKSFNFTFLDFDKVSFEEEITIRKRVKNLTQMNLSTPGIITITDRLKFLKEYLRQCRIIDEKKEIFREIINLSKTEKILYVSSNGDVTEDW